MFGKRSTLPPALSLVATLGIFSSFFLAGACSSEGDPEPAPSPDPKHAHIDISGDGEFGDLTASLSFTRTFTVSNSGEIDATLGAITQDGLGLSAPFALAGGTCASGQTLYAASTNACTIVVAFAPADAARTTQAMTVKFRDASDIAEQGSELVLSGTGVLDCQNYLVPACPKPAPALAVSDGATFSFGTVIVSLDASHTFTVTNTGNADAILGAITPSDIGLPAPFALTGGTCATGGTVAKNGGSCTLSVKYAPTTPSESSATIRIRYSGDNLPRNEAIRTITGRGELDCENHEVALCPPALPRFVFGESESSDFGKVSIGVSPKLLTLTLTNRGRVDGTLKPLTDASLALALPFALAGGTCVSASPLALKAKGGSCTLTISFTPQKPGAENQTLSVSYAGENGDALVTRELYGTSVLDCAANPSLATRLQEGVTAATTDNGTQTALGTAAGKAASYKTGYNDGYAATYQAAYAAAYQTAYTQVYNARYQGWYTDAYNAACPGATATGRSDGIAAGTEAGNYDGYHTGYYDGYTAAYGDSYDLGYDDAADDTCGAFSPEAPAFKARIAGIAQARASGVDDPASFRAPDPAQDPSNGQACYDQGYIRTYKPDSYQTAYLKAAVSNDYTAGRTAGTNQADLDAKAAGASAGNAAGTKAAQDEGTAKGASTGLSECYTSAYNSNYTASYNTAYNSTYTPGSSDGDIDGTSGGYTEGYQAGVAACTRSPAPARYLPPVADAAPPGIAPTRYFQPSYGLNQPWAAEGPHGVILDLFVQKPMLHGVPVAALNRDLRNRAFEAAKASVAPTLRVRMLNRHRAGQATLK